VLIGIAYRQNIPKTLIPDDKRHSSGWVRRLWVMTKRLPGQQEAEEKKLKNTDDVFASAKMSPVVVHDTIDAFPIQA